MISNNSAMYRHIQAQSVTIASYNSSLALNSTTSIPRYTYHILTMHYKSALSDTGTIGASQIQGYSGVSTYS